MGGDVAADIGKGVSLVRGHYDLIEMEFEKEKGSIRSQKFARLKLRSCE